MIRYDMICCDVIWYITSYIIFFWQYIILYHIVGVSKVIPTSTGKRSRNRKRGRTAQPTWGTRYNSAKHKIWKPFGWCCWRTTSSFHKKVVVLHEAKQAASDCPHLHPWSGGSNGKKWRPVSSWDVCVRVVASASRPSCRPKGTDISLPGGRIQNVRIYHLYVNVITVLIFILMSTYSL